MPTILAANRSSVLLDGEPKLLPIPESKLMRVANTPFAMLYDTEAKTYYLKGGDTWLSASDLKGPWKDMESLPADLQKLQAKLEEKKEEITKKGGKEKPKKEVEKKIDESWLKIFLSVYKIAKKRVRISLL